MKSKKKSPNDFRALASWRASEKKCTHSLLSSWLCACVVLSVASERESNGKISRVESTLRRLQRRRALAVCNNDWIAIATLYMDFLLCVVLLLTLFHESFIWSQIQLLILVHSFFSFALYAAFPSTHHKHRFIRFFFLFCYFFLSFFIVVVACRFIGCATLTHIAILWPLRFFRLKVANCKSCALLFFSSVFTFVFAKKDNEIFGLKWMQLTWIEFSSTTGNNVFCVCIYLIFIFLFALSQLDFFLKKRKLSRTITSFINLLHSLFIIVFFYLKFFLAVELTVSNRFLFSYVRFFYNFIAVHSWIASSFRDE